MLISCSHSTVGGNNKMFHDVLFSASQITKVQPSDKNILQTHSLKFQMIPWINPRLPKGGVITLLNFHEVG